jgi:predicted nucleic-acid-binding Zn-ribbon protein
METRPCPKCNEKMDEGLVNPTGSGVIGYISQKQTGILKTMTKINQARVCPNCGYVELYLDPKELKQRLT